LSRLRLARCGRHCNKPVSRPSQRATDIAHAPSAAVGKSLWELISGCCCAFAAALPHTGLPPPPEGAFSRGPGPRPGIGRGGGWVTDDCGPLLEDGSPGVGVAPLVATVVAGGVADEGRDHPDPGADRDCGAAVSFVVTRREWEGAVCVCGRAFGKKRLATRLIDKRDNWTHRRSCRTCWLMN
jgi:hypothetical protein